jgi:hypothetical protein
MLVIEYECGGGDAAGGGCGGPLGARVVTEAEFNSAGGIVTDGAHVHLDRELLNQGIDPDKVSAWMTVWKAGSCCWRAC